MQYNLIRNGYFDSLIASGTGNTELAWVQLESLMDGVTTSGGVTLTSSGILFLEVDLSQRIKVDEIRLYANDLNQSAYINFYYKNASGDSYTLLTTQSGSYYYAVISDPSAPQYIRATISGVSIILYELEVINDDYIVAFGEDGSLYAEYLSDTPIGEEGTPQAIAIFNNGTGDMPADVYACIDYTGETTDRYVKISETQNGTYYGIMDGALIEDDQSGSEYRWSSCQDTIGTSMILGDSVKNFGKLSLLPLISKSNFTNSAENCWDYDEVNKKIYVVASDSIIKLYEFDVELNTWTYVGELNPGGTGHAGCVAIGYMSGYIYATCTLTNTGPVFGRFNLSTKTWTTLASPAPGSYNTYRYNVCSDYNRYIYTIRAPADGNTGHYFGKYDTVTDTWSSLNTGWRYWHYGGPSYVTFNMWYDTTRDRLYCNASIEDNSVLGEGRYLQIYTPSSNSWSDLLHVYDIVGGTVKNWSFAYDKVSDSIWMMFSSKINTLYKYSLGLGQLTSYTINFSEYSAGTTANHMIAIPTAYGTPIILMGNISGDRTYVYHYQAVGRYVTPIFKMYDSNSSSYFITQGTAVSGLGTISYDSAAYNGTIRVKSSNTEPVLMNEVYTLSQYSTTKTYMNMWAVYPNVISMYKYRCLTGGREFEQCGGLEIDRRTGYACIAIKTGGGETGIGIYNRSGSELYYVYLVSWLYFFNVGLEFDYAGGVWGYGNYNNTAYRLVHFSYDLSVLATIYDGSDFLYALTAEWDGDGVWYTDKVLNQLVHRNSIGTMLQSVTLTQPRCVCSTTDNGCWVIDNSTLYAYRYNSSAVLVQSVYLGRTASSMTYDYSDGFWYLNNITVYHVTSGGVTDVSVNYSGVVRLKSARNGCLAYNSGTNSIKFLDYATKTFTKTWSSIDNVTNYDFGVFSLDISSQIDYKLGNADNIPTSYDPVWGTSGTLSWREVRKDGYFLPKTKYHQVEVTLRGNATLEKIVMSPAIKIQDIASQTYKNVYIKTDIPVDADIADCEARIKTWWGVE